MRRAVRAASRPARGERRGVGRAGRRPALRRHAGVRDGPRRRRGLGGRRRRLPRPAHALDPARRGREDRRPRRSTASSCGCPRSARWPTAPRRASCSTPLVDALPRLDRRAAGDRGRAGRPAARDGAGAAARRAASPPTASSAASTCSPTDADALDAFRVANRAVAARARAPPGASTTPAWRPFQLAFILLNLPGIADPRDPRPRDRRPAVLPDRRRQDRGVPRPRGLHARAAPAAQSRRGAAGGRERADALHAAAAHARPARPRRRRSSARWSWSASRTPERYGDWPFEIGLWVGKAATPNRMGRKGDEPLGHRAREGPPVQERPERQAVADPARGVPVVRRRASRRTRSRCCPTTTRRRELRIVCTNLDCEFTGDRPLPIVAVDEPIYRRLPASSSRRSTSSPRCRGSAESGALLGGADRARRARLLRRRASPGAAGRCRRRSPPPDLVIQDELHLISGPLGTMVGPLRDGDRARCACARSTARRCARRSSPRPRPCAARRTRSRRCSAVALTQVFPPPGPDRRDSFFARTVPPTRAPARLYVGVAAQGRSPKVVLRKV